MASFVRLFKSIYNLVHTLVIPAGTDCVSQVKGENITASCKNAIRWKYKNISQEFNIINGI